jgi:hypothetical protein
MGLMISLGLDAAQGSVLRQGPLGLVPAGVLDAECVAQVSPRNEAATLELLGRLSGERDRIDRQISELVSTRDRLDAVVASAAANWQTGQHCRPSKPPADSSLITARSQPG